jgi:hypothetical protein
MYFDEAGNFDFSPGGSKYFIMTAVVSRRPFAPHGELLDIKYDCLETGLDLDRFHATEDRQSVRDRVYDAITNWLDEIEIYSVIIQKNRTNPMLRDGRTLYLRAFDWLTKYACPRSLRRVDRVVAVTDRIPVAKRQGDVKQALKRSFKQHLGERTYCLFHHDSRGDLNLQVADYVCWAIQRKWERGDDRSYKLIQGAIRGEGDLFRDGGTNYYQYPK